MRVLVCGGRTFGVYPGGRLPQPDNPAWVAAVVQANHDREWFRRCMAKVYRKYPDLTIIEGGAKGADRLAQDWARDCSIPCETYPADWDRYGKAAGMIRNSTMLVQGKPDAVIAFPGGTGTAHMARIAREAGLPVWEPLAA